MTEKYVDHKYSSDFRPQWKFLLDLDSDWQRQKTILSSGIEAVIPPDTYFRDLGLTMFSDWEGYNYSRISGDCIILRDDKDVNSISIVTYAGISADSFDIDFVKGHEEGHFATYTGNLSKVYDMMVGFGLKFNFFPIRLAEDIDHVAVKALEDYPISKMFDEYMWYNHELIESIANLHGLLSVIEKYRGSSRISEVVSNIRKMNVDVFGLSRRERIFNQ